MALPGFANAEIEAANTHYAAGSIIGRDVEVMDSQGLAHSLLEVVGAQNKKLNLLFIFGGGGMGSERARTTGGIWCPDSFEDLHIFRTLADNYNDSVGFVAVACPPVFHSKLMGYADRAFLDYSQESDEYKMAVDAFISSTQRAFEQGLIPLQPYFDPRFRLLMSTQAQQSVSTDYGEIPSWQGAFRAANETQSYGVPNFWLLGEEGKVLTEPFRGNVYHPHAGRVNINYSLADIISAIDLELG